jgi:hypothetical protein
MNARARLLITILLAFAGALIVALIIASDDDGADSSSDNVVSTSAPASETSRAGSTTEVPPKQPPVEQAEERASGPKQGHQAQQEGPSGPAPSTDPERAASTAVDGFVAALDKGDGRAVCAAFSAGALDGIKFPSTGADCAATVERSLGYRDPRGLPVWRDSKPTGDISARIDGDDARVTATIVTRYRGQREPSVEDDVLYLRRQGGNWLLLKPSATFYRAIGVADVPLEAFRPPG